MKKAFIIRAEAKLFDNLKARAIKDKTSMNKLIKKILADKKW